MSYLYLRNGIWYVRVKQDGRHVYRSLNTRNRREAEKLRRDIDAIQKNRAVLPKVTTLNDYLLLFEQWADTHVAKSTWDFYSYNIMAFLAACPCSSFDDMTRERIQAGIRALEKSMSPRSVANVLKAMRVFLSRCLREGWYDGTNVFAYIDRPKIPERRPRWLTPEESRALLWHAAARGRNTYLFVVLGMFAGLRKGEADAARWEWFDWEHGLLHIQQSEEFQTKSRKERTIPIGSDLRTALEPFAQTRGYLIQPGEAKGEYRYRFDIRKGFAPAVKAAGVPWCTPHTLRHTFASRLVSAGVSLYKVQIWLGHSSTTQTQVYAHLAPQDADIDRALVYTSPKEDDTNGAQGEDD